jgi:ABC-2 type transport system permease protein
MNGIRAIAQREFSAYFGQPLAYIVLFLFVGLLALPGLWFNDVLADTHANMRTLFFWIAASFVLFVPALTMRLIAEERRTGSIEILCTLPINPRPIIFGKWLAAVGLVAVALTLTLTYPIALSTLGELDWGPVIGGYFGLLLMGASFAAIGLATSALSRFQLVSFLLAAILCGLPWAFGFFLGAISAEWVNTVQYLTFNYHFNNLAIGTLDSRSVLFFVSVTLVSLEIAAFALQRRRLI